VLAEQGRTAEAATLRQRAMEVATKAERNRYGYTLLDHGKMAEAVKSSKKAGGGPWILGQGCGGIACTPCPSRHTG
jgi:hypothetical protein